EAEGVHPISMRDVHGSHFSTSLRMRKGSPASSSRRQLGIFPRPFWAGVGGGDCARQRAKETGHASGLVAEVVRACWRKTPPPSPRPQGAGGYTEALHLHSFAKAPPR